MSFWNRIFTNNPDHTDQNSELQPLRPFEHWVDDDPVGGRRLCRPLLYALQHKVLPQALFIRRPALLQALTGVEDSAQGFNYLLSLSALRCEGIDGWPEDTLDEQDAYSVYSGNLLQYIVRDRYEREHAVVSVVRMPPPIATPEAHFVALVTATEYWNGQARPSMKPRYFLLERSIEPGTYCMCEWTEEGTHHNYGAASLVTSTQFANLAFERVASGA